MWEAGVGGADPGPMMREGVEQELPSQAGAWGLSPGWEAGQSTVGLSRGHRRHVSPEICTWGGGGCGLPAEGSGFPALLPFPQEPYTGLLGSDLAMLLAAGRGGEAGMCLTFPF